MAAPPEKPAGQGLAALVMEAPPEAEAVDTTGDREAEAVSVVGEEMFDAVKADNPEAFNRALANLVRMLRLTGG